MPVSQSVKDLSARLLGGLKINDKVDSNLYHENLPEGLTPELAKQHDEYDAQFIAASAHASGQLAHEAFAADKKVTQASFGLAMGDLKEVSHVHTRHKTYTQPGSDTKIEVYGAVTTKLSHTAERNVGDLKQVRNELKDAAAAAFGSKK
jgi:superoxide dismutase